MPARNDQVQISILGPLKFIDDDADGKRYVDPPSGRPRELLELLLTSVELRANADDLARVLWPAADTHLGRRRLQMVASRVRRSLPTGAALQAENGVYILRATTDVHEFYRLADAVDRSDTAAAQRALAMWRGTPFEDFADTFDVRHLRSAVHGCRDELERVLDAEHNDWQPAPSNSDVGTTRTEIRRNRLLEALPMPGRCRLVAFVAPAGFGKTVLLHQWAHYASGPMATVSLDADDETALLAGIRHAYRATRPHLPSADLDDPPVTLGHLVNEFWADNRPTAIVLDGLEHLTDPAAHHALADLIRLVPSHITVAMASRRPLPSAVSRQLATAESVMLGPDQLAFTNDELSDLTKLLTGQRDAQLIEAVSAGTNGWPAASAALVALAQRSTLRDLPGEFLDDVLRDVAEHDRAWLLATAHLEDLNVDLCDAVTSTPSRPIINRLATSHYLLDRVDGRTVPRPPIQQLLRHRQPMDELSTRHGHAQASRWYFESGHTARSLDHALASDDWELVRRVTAPALRAAAKVANLDVIHHWTPTLDRRRDLPDEVAVLMRITTRSLGDRRLAAMSGPTTSSAAMAAVIEALDLWADGHCRAALDALTAARRLHAATPSGDEVADTGIDRILDTVEHGCRFLIDADSGLVGIDAALRTATTTDWPWAALWRLGQLALHAYVADEPRLAASVLEQARRPRSEVHPSGREIASSYATIAGALIDERLDSNHPFAATTARIGRLADHADQFGMRPVAVAARYAHHRLLARDGSIHAAEVALRVADSRRRALDELGFLDALRQRCVEGSPDAHAATAGLTEREREVLQHLDSDLTMREIADSLYISVHTVRSHARSIYNKLGVGRRADAVALLSRATSARR